MRVDMIHQGKMNDTLSPYRITPARPSDLPLIGAIEIAAAKLLTGYAPDDVLAERTDLEQLKDACRQGHLWIGRLDDAPVGFAHVLVLEPGVAHLGEVDVHPDHGRRGLGRRLVRTVCDWAAASEYASVTLSTFRDVPWNMPFYASMGFEIVPPPVWSDALRAIVDDEARRGLDPVCRVVMRYRC